MDFEVSARVHKLIDGILQEVRIGEDTYRLVNGHKQNVITSVKSAKRPTKKNHRKKGTYYPQYNLVVDDVDCEIMKTGLEQVERRTSKKLSEFTGFSYNKTLATLKELQNKGIVAREKEMPSRSVIYSLRQEG
jgi:hypothetical protein